MKKAIRAARKKSGYTRGSTGKNWEKEYSDIDSGKNDKVKKDLLKKRDEAYRKVEKYDWDDDLDNVNKYQELGDSYAVMLEKHNKKNAQTYAAKYQDAILKDIGYTDIEKGRKMLADYGVHVEVSNQGWGKIKYR